MELGYFQGGLPVTLGGLLLAILAYRIAIAAWNLFLHPLSKFPGPKMYAISNLPAAWASIRGRYVTVMSQLHEKYGDTVRIGPNNLSFSSSTAFKDILAIKPGRPQLTKDPVMYNVPINGVHSILTTPSDADHARYRRLLAHGFSEKAMREQEPLIKGYVDLLIQRLREHAKDGPQDMVAWYNWTTFDLIGDLTFNEPFSCLENATYHPWIEFVFGGVKAAQLLSQARKFPLFRSILMFLFRKKLIAARLKGAEFTKAKVDHRIRAETDRLDFLGYVLRHEGKDVGMSRKEIDSTSTILVLGGSETTATLLSGVTYYLLSNPRTMERLVKEIREKFNSEDEITISSVNTLPYQLAVLEEAMRIFPPAPIGSPRVVGENGQAIDGQLVPGGTSVQPSIYSAAHSSRNFKDPETFAPERWLGEDPRYADDDRSASQAFSMGPRNCIGKNLAYAEMRLILARVLWNFDLVLEEESKGWIEGMPIFTLWQKPPLQVRLSAVR